MTDLPSARTGFDSAPTTTTVGVIGSAWRAGVTPWGAIVPWDGSPTLDWYVAADDRWHVPGRERSVRQVRQGGTPVLETRVRIPGGDALHRTWTVADDGGHTAVELVNDSPLPIAVAFSRRDLKTDRPPAAVPIDGIDLPAATTIVLPIGHHASVTVALAHRDDGPGSLPAHLGGADAVARGWLATSARAGSYDLPDAAIAERVVTERCDVALAGPVDAGMDPVGFLLGIGELVRMGDPPEPWVDLAAAAAERVARLAGWDVDAGLAAAAAVLTRAGERRARRDVATIVAGRPPSSPPADTPPGIRAIAAIEGRLARNGALLPDGVPAGWRGAGIECRGLPIGPASTVSFAIRWHGDRPAVLWEVAGEPVALAAPAIDPTWHTTAPTGEALWPPY